MRSVWSGNLAFGLVSIPVKLGSAVSAHRISFRQVHLADQGRVRYQKTCELDQQVLETSDIGRAYQTPDDQLVEITDADLLALPLPTAKTIEVNGFVELASVDSIQLDTPYFLAPSSPAANKPYVLMREALARSGKAAVGKFAMRNSEHLALITAREEVLLLQTLRWPDELNSAAEAVPRGSVKISDNELRLADTLIEALGEADLSAYHDEYAQALEALVAAKLGGAELPEVAAEGAGGQVVDLMAALRASVDAARGGEGESGRRAARGAAATVTELTPAGRTRAAKKTAPGAPARKPPAKKTTARKTTQPTAGKAAASKSTTVGKSAAKGTTKSPARSQAAKTATKKTAAKQAPAKKSASKRRAG